MFHKTRMPQHPKVWQHGLFPLQSPLLRESLLVSFPPLNYMLKFGGSSCLIGDPSWGWGGVDTTTHQPFDFSYMNGRKMHFFYSLSLFPLVLYCFSSNSSSLAGDGMNRGRIGTLSLMKRQVCSLTGLQVPHPHDLKAPFDSNETKRVKEERFDKIESCESALRGTTHFNDFKRV